MTNNKDQEKVAKSASEVSAPLMQAEIVGNVAKMRGALEQAKRVLHCAIVADILKGEDAHEALNVVTDALSSPKRNCDRFYNKCNRWQGMKDAKEAFCQEVERIFLWDGYCCERLINWLFAEAKGGTR